MEAVIDIHIVAEKYVFHQRRVKGSKEKYFQDNHKHKWFNEAIKNAEIMCIIIQRRLHLGIFEIVREASLYEL